MRGRILVFCLGMFGAAAASAADYQGSLDWPVRAELGTLVSGVVSKVNVQAGQSVSKGDVLLALDERDFSYKVSSAKAIYKRAQANLDEAMREYERSLELYDRRLLSDHELQLKNIALIEAQATLELSRAAMRLSELDLERSVLKAPFDGRVIAVLAQPGEAILNNLQLRPLILLAGNDEMRAVAKVDSKAADKLKVGTPASVGVRGDWLIGSVVEVGSEPVQVTDKEVYYLLTATFSPGEALMRAGEKAIVRIQD